MDARYRVETEDEDDDEQALWHHSRGCCPDRRRGVSSRRYRNQSVIAAVWALHLANAARLAGDLLHG